MDELSHGAQGGPATWSRRWLMMAVAAGVAGVLGWTLHDASPGETSRAAEHSLATTAPSVSPTPSASAAPMPTAFERPALRNGVRAEVILGGVQPMVVDLPSGRTAEITGLPDGYEVTAAVRVAAATLLVTGYEASEPPAVYALPDGTTAARRVASRGFEIMPAESDQSFWVYTWTPGSEERRGVVEERTPAGQLLRRAVLPRQWRLVRGVHGGLLIARFHPKRDGDAGIEELAVWDPRRRRIVRSLARGGYPVAMTATTVAWPDARCDIESEGCVLHITDVGTGKDRLIQLSRGYASPLRGVFSPDGSAVALAMLERIHDVAQTTVMVDTETGQVRRLTGATAALGGTTVEWTPDGEAVVLTATGLHGGAASLAIWRRSGGEAERVHGDFGSYPAVAVRPAS